MTKTEIHTLDTYAKILGFVNIYEMDALLVKAVKGSPEVLEWGRRRGTREDLLTIIKTRTKKGDPQ